MDEITEIFAAREPLNLDELAAAANALLPRFLPERGARNGADSDDSNRSESRRRGEMNPRLVRHMASVGLIGEPLRVGREARYTRRHLLQLLTARRLMAEGLSSLAVKKLVAGAPDARLEALLRGEMSWSDEVSLPLELETFSADFEPTEAALDLAGASEAAESQPSPAPPNEALSFLQGIARRGKAAPAPPVSSPAPAPVSPRASPLVTPSTAPSEAPLAEWVRLEIAPGLEVHVRADFRAPTTPYEREILLAAFGSALQSATKTRSRRAK